MQFGSVKWFNDAKGFGFIELDDDSETNIFVHYSQIAGDGYRSLNEGDRVTFESKAGPKGLYAENVSKVEK